VSAAVPLPILPVAWDGEIPGALRLLDQRALPAETRILECRRVEEVFDAIRTLAVRGAPAIGVAAAYGVVVAVQESRATTGEALAREVDSQAAYLARSRPTAVNLFWALDRMRRTAAAHAALGPPALLARLLAEARAIQEEDLAMCRRIGAHGEPLVPDGARILTHCNAGGLATAGYGTAVGVVYAARERGKRITVFADETRPLLQGSRLTAWELAQAGIDVTLVCDGTAGFLMRRGKVDLAIVGADRIARNGDAANKIGTYSVAVLARAHGIPFYVAAPSTTFDLSIATGDEIPIEERDAEEVLSLAGRRTAPEGVAAWNPAFDVTPASLITAIITERGVIRPVDEAHVLAAVGNR
jgi:methylthioribose-1-phosphate isomerase